MGSNPTPSANGLFCFHGAPNGSDRCKADVTAAPCDTRLRANRSPTPLPLRRLPAQRRSACRRLDDVPGSSGDDHARQHENLRLVGARASRVLRRVRNRAFLSQRGNAPGLIDVQSATMDERRRYPPAATSRQPREFLGWPRRMSCPVFERYPAPPNSEAMVARNH